MSNQLLLSCAYHIPIDAPQYRNSFISWASNFYGHNDMDIVRRSRPWLRSAHLIFRVNDVA
jgi:hypothetical protein